MMNQSWVGQAIPQSWKSWTPSWTNLTTGNGTLNYAKFVQIGKTVHFRLKFTLGSTSSIGGSVSFSAPVELNADYAIASNDAIESTGSLIDTGTANYECTLKWATSTTIAIRALNAGATHLIHVTLSSTVPHTWANTDVISIAGTYEAA